ncbi:hypothetical protein NDU88_007003 [Pleurodeles waltl]|uniref:Uncharacterized protein n=1 Tax=Pleurodeles waltl TaxID=8319 RepID=A0AAV7UMP4_PLEWA|nr:hypothetical protein NDU88_007003 [Pleurodeles waltl]
MPDAVCLMSQDCATLHREQGSRSAPRPPATASHRSLSGGCPPSRTRMIVLRVHRITPGAGGQIGGPVREPHQVTAPSWEAPPIKDPQDRASSIEDSLLPAGLCRGPGSRGADRRPSLVYQRSKLPQTTASCWGPSSCPQDLRHEII